MLSISVIIPVHNGGKAFLRCLESVSEAVSRSDEIVVVADGETDGVWRNAYSYGARVISNLNSKGPAFARNLGAKAALGDVLLFIDADVVIKPDTISLIRQAFLQQSDLAAVFGSYDSEPGATSFLSRYRNYLHHYTHQHACEEATTFWAGCGAVRAGVFKKDGWFDESYASACVEDIELGYRLTAAGHRIALRKDIQVKHLKKWGALNMIRTDLFARAAPWTELILSYGALRNDLNLRIEHRLSVILIFCFLGSILISAGLPSALTAAVIFAVLLVVLNWKFYRYLYREQGLNFMLISIPWHWLFYFYAGIGFVLGNFRFGRRKLFSNLRKSAGEDKISMNFSEISPESTWAEAKV